MATQEIDRIRSKVEDGLRLDAQELEQLAEAARTEMGPSLKLALAHALINAGEPGQALPLLQALRRDYPKDVQAALGHARALTALERYGEAERALKAALALNPQDLEAQKALAVCELRRGEVMRARRRVEEVLEADPFDSEAQLLLAELSSAELSGPHRVTRQEFITSLVAALKARALPHLLQRHELLVKLGKGGTARLDLTSLHAAFLAEGRSLAVEVDTIARELAERTLGVPDGREAVLERVMPVLRASAFVEKALGAVHRDGPADLVVYYVLDDSELVRYLPEGTLLSHQVGLDEVDRAAWENLDKRPLAPRKVELDGNRLVLTRDETGLYALAQGDGHDGARLLCPNQRAVLEAALGPAPYAVFLGLRELVVVCREADEAAMRKLGRLVAADDGIPGLFRFDGSGSLHRLRG